MDIKQYASAIVLLTAFSAGALASTGPSYDKEEPTGKTFYSKPSQPAKSSPQTSSERDVDFGMGLGDFTIGLGLLSTKLDSYVKATTSTFAGLTQYYQTSNTELNGEASVGYLWHWNKSMDTAIELYYDCCEIETRQSNVRGGNNKHTLKQSLGIRVLPGFYITKNTKLFLDLGWAYLDQEISVKNSGAASEYAKTSKSDWTSAYRYGAGVQMDLMQNFSLRASYTVADGGEWIKLTDIAGNDSIAFKPTVHNFAVNVLYNFAI